MRCLTDTGFKVLMKAVTLVTGANWAAVGMLTVMRASAIVVPAAVHDLHLDSFRNINNVDQAMTYR